LKELSIRTITGLIYVIALLGAPLVGPWIFLGTYLLLCLFTLNEFVRLSNLEGSKPLLYPTVIIGLLPLLMGFLSHQTEFQSSIILILLGGFLLILVLELFRKSSNPAQNIAFTIMSWVYIGIPFGLLPELLFSPMFSGYSPILLAFVLLIIWVHDTGAYLVGLAFGKHQLAKSISPNKTIEGLAGGILLGSVTIFVFTIFLDVSTWHLWVIGLVVIIFSNMGDLFESKWKRHLGIKDSGKSLPGHGGWLDRLDSFIFAIPATYLVLMLLY
jgi:phosphatidate cytidylyltransferase